MLSTQTIIAKIDSELAAIKARPPYEAEAMDLLGALGNAQAQGQEMALLQLRLWIAENELPEAVRA